MTCREHGRDATTSQADPPTPPTVQQLGLPVVIAGDPAIEAPFPTLGPSEEIGPRAAVDHLLALGHRRIAYVSGPLTLEHARRRRDAWAGALVSAGVRQQGCVNGDFTGEGGERATRQLLENEPRPTAIVYGNDLMAMAGVSAITSAGLRVPADISVVGYDDVPIASRWSPPLTSVRQDVAANARAVAARLLSTITDSNIDVGPLDPPNLVVRGSTALPPS